MNTLLITGTSRGIGLHLAQHFLESGHRVIGISRSKTPIHHNQFSEIRADISQPETWESIRQQIEHEPIKGLINNAGIHGPLGPFEGNNFNKWIEAFQVNLFAAARLSQICIPTLKENKGFIIFLSGGGSGYGRTNFSAYGVSKTAVVRLAENLAMELRPNVFVYCVAPGPNSTSLLEEAIRHGTAVPPEERVNFSEPIQLCNFLARNTDPRYSGKFIHVKDNYREWGERELGTESYTLRRLKIGC